MVAVGADRSDGWYCRQGIIRTAFAQPDYDAAVLAFPKQRRTKLHFKNPLERIDEEIERRTDLLGSNASRV